MMFSPSMVLFDVASIWLVAGGVLYGLRQIRRRTEWRAWDRQRRVDRLEKLTEGRTDVLVRELNARSEAQIRSRPVPERLVEAVQA